MSLGDRGEIGHPAISMHDGNVQSRLSGKEGIINGDFDRMDRATERPSARGVQRIGVGNIHERSNMSTLWHAATIWFIPARSPMQERVDGSASRRRSNYLDGTMATSTPVRGGQGNTICNSGRSPRRRPSIRRVKLGQVPDGGTPWEEHRSRSTIGPEGYADQHDLAYNPLRTTLLQRRCIYRPIPSDGIMAARVRGGYEGPGLKNITNGMASHRLSLSDEQEKFG